MGKTATVDVVNTAIDVASLSLLTYGTIGIRKTLRKQNHMGVVLMATGIVVSVGNTIWIIKSIKGANKNDNSRTSGKSKHNWDGSGNY